MIPKMTERVYILEKLKNSHFHIGISLDGLQDTHDSFRKIKNGFNLATKHLSDFKYFSENKKFLF